ncbi:thioredoxin family protein [Prochlorothrix hollandica]|uniref:Thioredoxin domain-containing protein n=1 Tax=Prochlorothrix hollandica PCC 9006 = CALU 1027 TaxID=317619 RepID=A0A0M2PVT5_PROHO|nr:thioredoxin family protein [Prochlorothrix hollandica]KKJ00556.1 hypothetical protein PROH_10365 [Prochlorothrix hollandica PCC 9006 = CALU 1027]
MFLTVNDNTFDREVLYAATPVLVNVWAPWCGICRWVQPVLRDLQAKKPDTLKIVNVNADNSFAIVNTYRLTMLPTLLVFDQGHLCDRLEGFQTRSQFEQALNGLHLSHWQSLAVDREQAQTHLLPARSFMIGSR